MITYEQVHETECHRFIADASEIGLPQPFIRSSKKIDYDGDIISGDVLAGAGLHFPKGFQRLTPIEYRNAIAALGLSQVGAATFLGVNQRTSRRWASGETPIPRHVELLLRLMVRFNINPADL